jgi:hypothetical protein
MCQLGLNCDCAMVSGLFMLIGVPVTDLSIIFLPTHTEIAVSQVFFVIAHAPFGNLTTYLKPLEPFGANWTTGATWTCLEPLEPFVVRAESLPWAPQNGFQLSPILFEMFVHMVFPARKWGVRDKAQCGALYTEDIGI